MTFAVLLTGNPVNALGKGIQGGNADLHDEVTEGDTIDVEVNAKITHNGKAYPIASLPDNLVDILNAGGLVKAMRKLNGLD